MSFLFYDAEVITTRGIPMRFYGCFLALLIAPSLAFAGGRELADKDVRELETISASDIASDDLTFIYDTSEDKVKKTLTPLGATSFDTSLISTSKTLTGNPLMQVRLANINAASADANSDLATSGILLTSVSGKAIIPNGGLTVMASGTAGGATSVSLKCSSGRIIVTWPVALLVDQVPSTPFQSTASSTSVRGAGLTRGCGLNESVYLSATGAGLTTVTNFMVSLPYTVQNAAF